MFIGHFALGFAAKRAVPRVSLAVLFVASQLADLLWPIFLMASVEQVRIDPGNTPFTPLDFVHYPWSHSLVMLVFWGVLLGGAYRGIAGGRRSFVVIGALVASHWILDWMTHRADMPIYPGGPTYGLGLWYSIPGTIVIETLFFLAGVYVYLRATRPRNTSGRWAVWALAGTLFVIYLATVAGGAPPSVTAIGAVGIAGGVLLTVWAWWADRCRQPVGS